MDAVVEREPRVFEGGLPHPMDGAPVRLSAAFALEHRTRRDDRFPDERLPLEELNEVGSQGRADRHQAGLASLAMSNQDVRASGVEEEIGNGERAEFRDP